MGHFHHKLLVGDVRLYCGGRVANATYRLREAVIADAESRPPIVNLVILGQADQVRVERRALRIVADDGMLRGGRSIASE